MDVSLAKTLLTKGAYIKKKQIFFPKQHTSQLQDENYTEENEAIFLLARHEITPSTWKVPTNNCNIKNNINLNISCIYTKSYIMDFIKREIRGSLNCDFVIVDFCNVKEYVDSNDFEKKSNKNSGEFKIIIICNEAFSCEFLPGFFILGINQNLTDVERDLKKIFFSKYTDINLINRIEIQVTYFLHKGLSYSYIADCLGKKIKTIKNTPGAVKRRTGIKRNSSLNAMKMCICAYYRKIKNVNPDIRD